MDPILTVQDLEAGYQERPVLRGVSIHVGRGEVVALIGPNGAGKSTLLKCIFGLLKAKRGEIRFKNCEIQNRTASSNVRNGLSYVLQGGRVFDELSVLDNLKLGGFVLTSKSETGSGIRAVEELFPFLKERLPACASELSGGEQQMLALARALVIRPEFLLLDEPSLGLGPRGVSSAIRCIRELNKKWGTSILLVEQNVEEALSVAQRVYVLRLGQVALESDVGCVTLGRLREAFFG